jgi:malate:Na+ symporter
MIDAAVAEERAPPAPPADHASASGWRLRLRVGPIPAAIFLVIVALAAFFSSTGKVPSDLPTNIAILAAGGFACAELGRRLPGLRQVGAAAIFSTFIPSYLVYAHLLPSPLVASITTFTKTSNVLYLFISAIIVGSILGMDRRILVAGFIRIFAPLALGSVAAAAVGCAVGVGLGLGLAHTLFKIIVPIMAGGVGEGALPLSIGYAAISHGKPGDAFAEVLPAVMLGSLTAILISGGLNYLGKRRPMLTGRGRLQIGEVDAFDAEARPAASTETVAGATVMAVTLFLVGSAGQTLIGFPAPITMLLLTVLVKLGRLASPELEAGAFGVYQCFRVAVTYPLLFAIGVAMTPWDKVVAALNLPTLATIVATVTTLIATGFALARPLGMHPIEVAIVNACHSGQGGTGDVAILSAADRMQLMPFAQIATRIGGAITVTLALLAFRAFGPG